MISVLHYPEIGYRDCLGTRERRVGRQLFSAKQPAINIIRVQEDAIEMEAKPLALLALRTGQARILWCCTGVG